MEIVVILILTLLNGFFALSEVALISVKKHRMEQLVAEGNSKAKLVLKLLENPEDFLSSIQVGITLIGIVAGAYGGITLTYSLEQYLSQFHFLGSYVGSISFVIVIGAITYFSIIIGELVPKTIAMNNTEKVALFSVHIVKYLTFIAYPIVKLLSISTSLFLKLFGIKKNNDEKISEEDLQFMLKTAYTQGTLESEENQIHQNLFYFTDQTAKSLMTDRSQIEWLNSQENPEILLSDIKESVYGKFVVGDGSLDKIVGTLTMRNFISNHKKNEFKLKDIIVAPIFINPNTPVFKILNIFKEKRQYIAIVVDEFGTTRGIVTLHDIMEAIIGSLPDQYDDEDDENIVKREDGSYLLDGRTIIYELNQYFQDEVIEENISKYTTVSGFVIEQFGRIPDTAEKVTYGGYEFEIVDKDNVRIDKVLMTKI